MIKVLMIAHQFPPMAGAGVQRTSKFVKYLRKFDVEPIVLTREVGKMAFRDDSLLSDVPEGTQIIRTKPHDLTEWPGFLGLGGKFISRKIMIPDAEYIWAMRSRKKAEEIVEKNKIDVIYSTSYPYSDHLLALYLKERFPKIPWVADFRDEWSNNPYLKELGRSQSRMDKEKNMEKKVLETADIVITNTPVMMKNFINHYKYLESKFRVIPNGFDEEDFTDLDSGLNKTSIPDSVTEIIKPVPAAGSPISYFTVTYTGALYGRRKPDTFFEALSAVIKSGDVDGKSIKVRLIGSFKPGYIEGLIDKYDLNDIVETSPYMEHKESIRSLSESDALLLIEGNGPGAEAFFTGKVFEYMNTGRPILAVIPEKGAAAGLIRETKTGYVSDFSDIEAIKSNIKNFYDAWKEKRNIYYPDKNEIAKYERKELASSLSEIFKSVTKKQ